MKTDEAIQKAKPIEVFHKDFYTIQNGKGIAVTNGEIIIECEGSEEPKRFSEDVAKLFDEVKGFSSRMTLYGPLGLRPSKGSTCGACLGEGYDIHDRVCPACDGDGIREWKPSGKRKIGGVKFDEDYLHQIVVWADGAPVTMYVDTEEKRIAFRIGEFYGVAMGMYP